MSWGETLYFRDLGDPRYEAMWGFEPSYVDLCKLMCLFEILGLPDCAAELVLKYGESFGDAGTRNSFLDIFAAQQSGGLETYASLQQRFARDARQRFSPSRS